MSLETILGLAALAAVIVIFTVQYAFKEAEKKAKDRIIPTAVIYLNGTFPEFSAEIHSDNINRMYTALDRREEDLSKDTSQGKYQKGFLEEWPNASYFERFMSAEFQDHISKPRNWNQLYAALMNAKYESIGAKKRWRVDADGQLADATER